MVLEEFSGCKDTESGYSPIEVDFTLGDGTRACFDREMQSNGKYRVWYRLEFVYRNVYHAVVGWGWEDEVTIQYVKSVADTLLAKLERQPLSDEVTFAP